MLDLVLADGPTTFDGSRAALDEGLVDKVGFTGSTAVGARIGELAGRHLQSACLELGGKNPMVVMPDADLDLAVQGALFSGFGTSGPALHEPRHGLGPPRRLRGRSATPSSRRSRARSSETRTRRSSTARCSRQRYLDNHVRNLELVADHHSVHGSTGTGRITSANPREGLPR